MRTRLLIVILLLTPVALRANPVMIDGQSLIAVGVVFGYIPARKAARLDPIEALRRE